MCTSIRDNHEIDKYISVGYPVCLKIDPSMPEEGIPDRSETPECLRFCEYRFIIGRSIGEGSFSSVYQAAYRSTGQPVAIKAITMTSSPRRILQELDILKTLGGKSNCIQLLEVLRSRDQVVAVFPLICHIDFKDFILQSTLQDVKKYIYSLLRAVKYIHDKNIVHRDIKPGNFLYNMEDGLGYLIDFGLAEYELVRDPTPPKSAKPLIFFNSIVTPSKPPGYYERDSRPLMKAPRAGTRGFRAPEVLFRYENQTKAIDIWSVGVIMLCILSGQYPFFLSIEDVDGLAELGTIFGHAEMRKAAKLYGRVWKSNLHTIPEVKTPFELLIRRLNIETDELAIDLLKRLLELDYEKRITAREAMEHPFFSGMK